MSKYIYLFLLFISTNLGYASEKVIIDNNLREVLIGKHIDYFEDKEGKLSLDEIVRKNEFTPVNKDIVNFQVSKSTFWLKFTVVNKDNVKKKFVEIVQPLLDAADFYYPDNAGGYKVVEAGVRFPFKQRKYTESTNFVYDLEMAPGEEKTFYLKIKGSEQILLPIRIVAEDKFYSQILNLNIWFGIYCGIIIVMFLYNIFVYFSTRDKSYLFYVLHTLFVGITQATLTGFTYKYIWGNSTWFANYSVFLFTCLVSIVGVQFLIEFMNIRKTSPKVFKMLKFFQGIYVVYLFTSLLGHYSATFGAILPTQSTIALTILGVAIYLYRQGYSEAKFYLIGWGAFMVALVIYVSKDFGLIAYNNFTAYSLLFGSAAEVALLSFALADKINIFKSEKEASQAQALAASQENERLVRDQNIMLEQKVTERTSELQESNEKLELTLQELKDAEMQLVESEKMASLGQLTAGIAHEINNPINFVTSNVKPLQRDVALIINMLEQVQDISLTEDSLDLKKEKIETLKEEYDFDYLKTEIEYLLKGINEGSSRTAEIVKGLRIFSRLDEDDLKKANINEGIDSTIIIISNSLEGRVQIVKEYGDIPLVECYPGKLNQVFLNILANAVHAVKQQLNGSTGGTITIKTYRTEENVVISIKDNGTGMDEKTKKKLFEPFFTTKDVGEGTGLGLSIAWNTIQKHNGNITVNSEPGQGAEFVIELPIIHKGA